MANVVDMDYVNSKLQSPYTPAEDKTKFKIKEYGYWHIILRPVFLIKIMDRPTCRDIISKCQIRHRDWFFPQFGHHDTFASYCYPDGDYIRSVTHYAQYINWWSLHNQGLFEMQMGVIEDRLHNSSDPLIRWSPENQTPPPKRILDPINTLYQLIEIEQFVKNLVYYLDVDFYAEINLYGMKDRHLQPYHDDLNLESICKVDKISLKGKTISSSNKDATFALDHMRQIYDMFNDYSSTIPTFDDYITKQIDKFRDINVIKSS